MERITSWCIIENINMRFTATPLSITLQLFFYCGNSLSLHRHYLHTFKMCADNDFYNPENYFSKTAHSHH